MTMRKSPAATGPPPRAGTITAAAGPRNALSRNGSTTRTANKDPVTPGHAGPGRIPVDHLLFLFSYGNTRFSPLARLSRWWKNQPVQFVYPHAGRFDIKQQLINTQK
jgi:hypothetical protein